MRKAGVKKRSYSIVLPKLVHKLKIEVLNPKKCEKCESTFKHSTETLCEECRDDGKS